ncbi:MAG: glycerol-3-phosphate 1-O-acyltransferase [Gemmatimonadetes bacterium]|nr:glycerol-3-phosphate 1-O-acyltransferase [Gemmatimonadota bacterium]
MGLRRGATPDPNPRLLARKEGPLVTVPFALTVLAYALGTIPSSYWVGKFVFGVDLRTVGSGNLGATNAFRILGARAAVPVTALDVLKGWVPAAIFPLLIPGAPYGWTLAFGGAAILGHVFSFWVGFRGGKGVATSTGVFLALAPGALFVAVAVWSAAVLATGYVSVGSILAAVILPAAIALTRPPGGAALLGFASGLGAFVVWAHRSNIGRLMRGEEPRFRRHEPHEGAAK